MKSFLALLSKDLKIDLRQKYAIAGIGLYIFATIYISYLAFNQVINPSTWNALFWIVLLFSSITGIAKGFSAEENRASYYYFLVKPEHVLLAKLCYHLLYETLLVVISIALFSLWLGNPVANQELFLINLAIGAIGMAVAFTLVSALSAKAENSSSIMAILSFPVIIPVMVLAVSNSRKIVMGAVWSDVSGNMITLISVIVVIIALSFMLFPYSWKN